MTISSLQLNPLHSHTFFSVLDGASGIDEYVAWAKDNGSSAVGVTDHGWVIGLAELIEKCGKAGLKALPGCEFYLVPPKDHSFAGKAYDYFHGTAWAINQRGYQNLLKLGSISFHEDELEQMAWSKEEGKNILTRKKRVVTKFFQTKPRITFEDLFAHGEGLVIGSGCIIGSVNKALIQGEYDGAERNLLRLNDVFRGRFYVELMPHAVTNDYSRSEKKFVPNECTDFSPDGDLQKACNLRSIALARKHGIPLLMTIDSHFVDPKSKPVQDCLLQNGDPDGWRFFNSYHMLTTNQAWDHWHHTYGDDSENRKLFAESVENNHVLADLAQPIQVKDRYHQPNVKFGDGIEIRSDDKEAIKKTLFERVKHHGRMKDETKWRARLDEEVRVICDNGIIDFGPYFLFLDRWAEWTREQSIFSAPGRGSGAGSLLCYLLRITHLDPFEYDLPFERFLSMGRLKRGKYGDVDWDLSEREVLLAKLKEEYGDRFAQCSTHGTLKVKSAIKDAARVLLKSTSPNPIVPLVEINEITATIPNTPTGVKDRDFLLGYESDDVWHDGHLDENPKLLAFFEKYPDVKEMVLDLLGVPRSVSRHASAFFISDRPISETVPTCIVSGETCTQYTAVPAEKAGLIKFDLLRVNTLADIASCIRLVQKKMGYEIRIATKIIGGEAYQVVEGKLPVDQLPMPDGRILDIYRLPEEEEVFKEFDQGNTESIFQMNTPLLTGFNKRVRPRSVKDLSALVALVRPGPLAAKIGERDGKPLTMTEAYILRKDGKIPVEYPHPGMEPILKGTYGVAVYQEQLQKIFSELVGYSSEEADFIRELIAKKKKQDMEKVLPEIRAKLVEKGWSEYQIHVLIDLCLCSASYSFNLSHSASYATVAYQSMYLKHHFPLEWWTSVLQNAKVEDIREKGYASSLKKILEMPHVNGPTETFELRDDGHVHAPLYLIDKLGDSASSAIRSERDRGGPFTSFQDFYDRVNRTQVDQGIFENLIVCGAFRHLHPATLPKDLRWLYYAFRRVQELKVGKGKKGADLLAAVNEHIEKGGTIEVDPADDLELEVRKIQALPIFRLDVHERFKDLLMKKSFVYGEKGDVTYWDGYRRSTTPAVRSAEDAGKLLLARRGEAFVAYAGLVQSQEEFQYKDKKTGQRVTALKAYIANDGDTIECVLWPNKYEKTGQFPTTKIILAKGFLKEAREPGKFSLSVQDVEFV